MQAISLGLTFLLAKHKEILISFRVFMVESCHEIAYNSPALLLDLFIPRNEVLPCLDKISLLVRGQFKSSLQC